MDTKRYYEYDYAHRSMRRSGYVWLPLLLVVLGIGILAAIGYTYVRNNTGTDPLKNSQQSNKSNPTSGVQVGVGGGPSNSTYYLSPTPISPIGQAASGVGGSGSVPNTAPSTGHAIKE